MSIRPARGGDFESIAAITNHYIATTVVHFGYEPVTAAELRATWEAARDRFPWLVTEVAGAVVAYAKAGVWRERAAYQWTAECGLYVADAHRGRGLGRAIYGALLDDLHAREFRSAIGGITLPNEPSVKLHEALGFERAGVFREVGFKHEQWRDVGFWQKLLADGR